MSTSASVVIGEPCVYPFDLGKLSCNRWMQRISSPQQQYYLQVKVVDFGISKVKLQDKSNTITRPKIGTTVYMPPEAFTSGRANWFKADVYSFSVMCSVILSGDEPFQGTRRDDIYGAICNGIRPELPGDIPTELELVIMKGWATDRNLRPSFVDMCTTLEKIRHLVLRNHSLGLSLKESPSVLLESTVFIDRMLETRYQVRKHVYSTDEDQWFNGDESEIAGTSDSQVKNKVDVNSAPSYAHFRKRGT